MRIVLQAVSEASVNIEDREVGRIGRGFLLLAGFTEGDDEAIVEKMAEKVIGLRIFPDDRGLANLSLGDIKGKILSISQFTLYADMKKGRRPSFTEALKPSLAEPLYDYFNRIIMDKGIHLEKGIFGADMKVQLVNDGPFTLVLDSRELLGGNKT